MVEPGALQARSCAASCTVVVMQPQEVGDEPSLAKTHDGEKEVVKPVVRQTL